MLVTFLMINVLVASIKPNGGSGTSFGRYYPAVKYYLISVEKENLSTELLAL